MSPRNVLKKAKGFACLLACLPFGGGGGVKVLERGVK